MIDIVVDQGKVGKELVQLLLSEEEHALGAESINEVALHQQHILVRSRHPADLIVKALETVEVKAFVSIKFACNTWWWSLRAFVVHM